jgi:hypothetical protein
MPYLKGKTALRAFFDIWTALRSFLDARSAVFASAGFWGGISRG